MEADDTAKHPNQPDLNAGPRHSERVKWPRYIPHTPTAKQFAFLSLRHPEALYGGSAGGGKSDALLMAALQYVDVPGYAAIIFRRTHTDLALAGGLIPRSRGWLSGSGAHWNERDKRWTFPSGATLSFGYLESPAQVYRYQSSEYAFCGFDELTQFSEFEYRYLFSRLRRLIGSNVPVRMRAASNPGGLGHDWVRQRFLVESRVEGRMFIRAALNDNPHLDREEYARSLQQLDPLTRRQLLEGDWSARAEGRLFRREWFKTVSEPPPGCRWARFWDLAATEYRSSIPRGMGGGSGPDWTAGALVGEADGVFYVAEVTRLRGRPAQVEELVRDTARRDGVEVAVFMEQEPGASGAALVDHYARRVLKGYAFRGVRHSGSKEVRAAPVSSAAEAGNVTLISGAWIGEFLDEIEAFPFGSHDDQVDALCGAIASLARGPLLRPGERAIAASKASAWTA